MSLEKAKELRRDANYALKKAHEIRDAANESEDGWTEEAEERFNRWMTECTDALQSAEKLEETESRLADAEERANAREEAIVGELAAKGFEDDDFGAGGRQELAERYDQEREQYEASFWRYVRRQPLEPEHRKALRRGPPVLSREGEKGIRYIQDEMRAASQTVGTSGAGGVLVPEDFRRQLVEEQKAFGGMRRSRATIFETDSGADMPVPTLADTANTGSFVNEASTISGTTGLSFSNVKLSAHTVQSGPINASVELIQDSAFDIGDLITRAGGVRIGRVVEDKFFSSTSSTGTPLGLITASSGATSVKWTTSTSTALTWDVLNNFKHQVDPAYRMAGAEWMFNDNTLLTLVKIQDADKRPLLQLGEENREVSRLLGHPFIINQNVESASSVAGQFPIWFGDFRHYFIRDVRAIEVMRLRERFAEKRQVGWLLFQRVDGKPVDPSGTAAQRPIRAIITTT